MIRIKYIIIHTPITDTLFLSKLFNGRIMHLRMIKSIYDNKIAVT